MLTVYLEIPASTPRFPLRSWRAPALRQEHAYIYRRLTCVACSEDPRGSSYGGKGDHGRNSFLSLSVFLLNCVWPRPRARFVDGKHLCFLLRPLSSRVYATPCRRTREHNYATRRHPCTKKHHALLLVSRFSLRLACRPRVFHAFGFSDAFITYRKEPEPNSGTTRFHL